MKRLDRNLALEPSVEKPKAKKPSDKAVVQ